MASSACACRLTKRASISELRRVGLGDVQHARDEERPAVQELDDLEALLALADQMMRAVRRGDVAQDVGDRADAVHVDPAGLGLSGSRCIRMPTWRCWRTACCAAATERGRPTRDRQHHAGEQHGVAHRHDDQRVRRQRRQRGRASMAWFDDSISASATVRPRLLQA